MDVLVMENVFYERALAPVYDLKGSSRARLSADDPADPASVLLDENLKQSSRSAPLLVRSAAGAGTPRACARRRLSLHAWTSEPSKLTICIEPSHLLLQL